MREPETIGHICHESRAHSQLSRRALEGARPTVGVAGSGEGCGHVTPLLPGGRCVWPRALLRRASRLRDEGMLLGCARSPDYSRCRRRGRGASCSDPRRRGAAPSTRRGGGRRPPAAAARRGRASTCRWCPMCAARAHQFLSTVGIAITPMLTIGARAPSEKYKYDGSLPTPMCVPTCASDASRPRLIKS